MIEQAKARRQAIVGEAPDPNCSLRAANINPASLAPSNVPLIPYQSSAILTPTPANSDSPPGTASSSERPSSDAITKPLGEMSLRDFEGDSNDPFETTALQAIDVFSELQSVLQPELSSNTQRQPPTAQTQTTPPVTVLSRPPKSSPTATPPYPFHTQTAVTQPPPVYSSSVPTTAGSGNVTQPSHNNFRPPPGGVGVLVDFGRHNPPVPHVSK